jgi:ATP-dependent phosphoenolpyruvate carboxykinase
MANLSGVVQQLKKAHAEAQGEVERLGAALAALGNLTGRSPSGKRRTQSAAARRKISLAQKARWAKRSIKTQTDTARPTRTMSAAGRRKIAAAQRARWAKVKAGKK